MIYYGLFKNNLGEWITFTRANHKSQIYPTMDALRRAGIPDERIKIVKATDEATHINFNYISLVMADGNKKTYSLHSVNPQTDFLAFCQMAMTGQLKDVLVVTLESPNHGPIYEWRNSEKLQPKDKELSPEAVQQLHAMADQRNGRLRQLYS